MGKDSVTIGAIKTPRAVDVSKNSTLSNITAWAESYLLIFFMALFTICLLLLRKPLNNQAFIIEKFQRRKDVNTKILFSGCAILFLLALGANQTISRELNIFLLIPAGYAMALITFLTFKTKLEFKQ